MKCSMLVDCGHWTARTIKPYFLFYLKNRISNSLERLSLLLTLVRWETSGCVGRKHWSLVTGRMPALTARRGIGKGAPVNTT